MRYLAIAFAAGMCAGWFLRRLRSKNDGDLPPLLLVVISIIAELLSAASGRAPLQALEQPLRRTWAMEQQVSEYRRRAFNGQVGDDTRAIKNFISFARTRWDLRLSAAAYAAAQWVRHVRPTKRGAERRRSSTYVAL